MNKYSLYHCFNSACPGVLKSGEDFLSARFYQHYLVKHLKFDPHQALTMIITEPATPFDSTVVVIGANGYLAVETCEKLLEAGFRVRGTVRNIEQNRWMHQLFDPKWPERFELVRVEDFTIERAFDAAFKGQPVLHGGLQT